MNRRKTLSVLWACLVPAVAGCSSGDDADHEPGDDADTESAEPTDDVQPFVQIRGSSTDASGQFTADGTELTGDIVLVTLEVQSADSDAAPDEFWVRGHADEIQWADSGGDLQAGEQVALLVGDDAEQPDGGAADGFDAGDANFFVFDSVAMTSGDTVDLVFETEDTSSVTDTYEIPEL